MKFNFFFQTILKKKIYISIKIIFLIVFSNCYQISAFKVFKRVGVIYIIYGVIFRKKKIQILQIIWKTLKIYIKFDTIIIIKLVVLIMVL